MWRGSSVITKGGRCAAPGTRRRDAARGGPAVRGYSTMAMRSPSWTTSPSATASVVTVPWPSTRTGISIFIDSRMTRVAPSSTCSPSAATTFQTFATISARISATRHSFRSGPQPGHHGRVIGTAAEFAAVEQFGMEQQVRLEAGDAERRYRVPRAAECLRAAGPVHAQLREQRVVERRDLVPGLVSGVDPDAGPGRLHPFRDRARAGQEPARILGVDPKFTSMTFILNGLRLETHLLPGGDQELLLDEVDSGDHLGYRVLHLEPGVHFQEDEIVCLGVDQAFHGPRAAVADRLPGPDGGLRHPLPQPGADAGGGSLLGDLLMPPLDRAIP